MNVYRSAQFCFGPACASLVLTQWRWSMKKWYMLIFLKLSENMMTGKWIRNLWLKLPTFYQHSYPGQLQPTQFYSCTLSALTSGPVYMTQLNRLKLKCYCTILTDWQKKIMQDFYFFWVKMCLGLEYILGSLTLTVNALPTKLSWTTANDRIHPPFSISIQSEYMAQLNSVNLRLWNSLADRALTA